MIYKIETRLSDGLAEMPSFEYDTEEAFWVGDLGSIITEELCNDEGIPFPVGVTVTIERIA